MSPTFKQRYGTVGVVAGASEGLGAAYATALAARGLDLVLLARRASVLDELAAGLRTAHGVEVTTVVTDLGDPAFTESLAHATIGREVGVAVYNAAASFTGPGLDRPLGDALRVIDVNVIGPVRFVHTVVPPMRARRRGGLVLMSSVAGFQGAPQLAMYAASKSFNIVLGESLWSELRDEGIDVVTSCAGAIRTPNYAKAAATEAPGMLDARVVAELTLDALGHGPIVVPGGVNKLALFLLRRLASRRGAVGMMRKNIAGAVNAEQGAPKPPG
jgi:hypothetical protein